MLKLKASHCISTVHSWSFPLLPAKPAYVGEVGVVSQVESVGMSTAQSVMHITLA